MPEEVGQDIQHVNKAIERVPTLRTCRHLGLQAKETSTGGRAYKSTLRPLWHPLMSTTGTDRMLLSLRSCASLCQFMSDSIYKAPAPIRYTTG